MPHSSPKLAELSNMRVSQRERKYRLPAEIWRCAFTEEYIKGVRKAYKHFSQKPFLVSIQINLKMHWFMLTCKGISTSFMRIFVLDRVNINGSIQHQCRYILLYQSYIKKSSSALCFIPNVTN